MWGPVTGVTLHPQWYPVHQMSFLFFFLVPVMLLIFFYTRMISTIRRANTSNIRRSAYRGNNSGGSTKPPDHRRQTIRMLGGWRVELQTNLLEDYPKVLQGAFSVIVKSLRNLREPSFEALVEREGDLIMTSVFAVSVVILFFISWSPFHFQRLGYVYFKNFNWFRMANQYLFYFSGEHNPPRNYTHS